MPNVIKKSWKVSMLLYPYHIESGLQKMHACKTYLSILTKPSASDFPLCEFSCTYVSSYSK